jgi:cytochrome c peroxidase
MRYLFILKKYVFVGQWANNYFALVVICGLCACLFIPHTEAFEAFLPLPKSPPVPEDNLITPAKTALGKELFFDTRLSYTGTVSCNSCHNVMAGGEDGRAVSVGALGKAGKRSAPTLWNVAYQTVYYWDGRAPSLEAAIKEHLISTTEMGMPDEASVLARLSLIPGYRDQFEHAFRKSGELNYGNITRAIATYIRTLVTLGSPFDRYLEGDKNAVTATVLQGHREFIEVGCASCHFWVNFAGPVPGLAFQMGEGFYELFPNYQGSKYDKIYRLKEDMGRYLVTKQAMDKRMWRVPTLRNIAITAPYFHNGSVATLEEAVRVMGKTQLDQELTDQQVSDIILFLNSLTGEFPQQTMPQLPPLPNSALWTVQ